MALQTRIESGRNWVQIAWERDCEVIGHATVSTNEEETTILLFRTAFADIQTGMKQVTTAIRHYQQLHGPIILPAYIASYANDSITVSGFHNIRRPDRQKVQSRLAEKLKWTLCPRNFTVAEMFVDSKHSDFASDAIFVIQENYNPCKFGKRVGITDDMVIQLS